MSQLEPILIVSDAHIPYHDVRAFKLMLKAAKALKPKHVVIIGDFMDFYAVSDHSQDPNRSLKLAEELKAGEAALDQLEALGASHQIYVGGNHEDRLRRYLQDKAPKLFNVVSVPELLHLKERGWHYVPYKKDIRIGKLAITHDVGCSGRTSVYKCLDTYQHSVVTGHSHRLAYIVEGNAVGEFKLSAQFGWLGDAAHVDYMQSAKVLKDWALGFGVGHLHTTTGIVYMTPVPIVKYTCCVNGKLYQG